MLRANLGGDPVDLLDSRTVLRGASASAAARRASAAAASGDGGFARSADGRLIIREEEQTQGGQGGARSGDGGRVPKRKRRPGGGFDERASDDSDFDDLRQIGGLARGMRSASAKSVRAWWSQVFLEILSRSLAGQNAQGSRRGDRDAQCCRLWRRCLEERGLLTTGCVDVVFDWQCTAGGPGADGGGGLAGQDSALTARHGRRRRPQRSRPQPCAYRAQRAALRRPARLLRPVPCMPSFLSVPCALHIEILSCGGAGHRLWRTA